MQERELEKILTDLNIYWFRQGLSLNVKSYGWMANGELGIHSMPQEHCIDNTSHKGKKVIGGLGCHVIQWF